MNVAQRTPAPPWAEPASPWLYALTADRRRFGPAIDDGASVSAWVSDRNSPTGDASGTAGAVVYRRDALGVGQGACDLTAASQYVTLPWAAAASGTAQPWTILLAGQGTLSAGGITNTLPLIDFTNSGAPNPGYGIYYDNGAQAIHAGRRNSSGTLDISASYTIGVAKFIALARYTGGGSPQLIMRVITAAAGLLTDTVSAAGGSCIVDRATLGAGYFNTLPGYGLASQIYATHCTFAATAIADADAAYAENFIRRKLRFP